MTPFDNAVVSPSGQGKVANAFGQNLIRIEGQDTGGRLGCLEVSLEAGEGTPFHIHAREDEFFRVLSGRFGFWCARDYVELEEGGCILLPRNVAHRFQNIGSAKGRVMTIVTPGGFEAFFPAIESRHPSGPEEIMAIAAEFGLTFLPPADA